MKIRGIKEAKNIKGKRVLVRVDYNLPINNGKPDFRENLRIRASIETIKFLLKNDATIILISHFGRPKAWSGQLSLEPVAKYLSKLLKVKINFIADNIEEVDISGKIKKGVNMLENIRFYEGEEKGSKLFARKIAKLGDVFVNEAFSVSHRDHASVCCIQNFLPAYAGIYLEKEVHHLARVLPKNIKQKDRPYVALMGGAKISTKISLIKKLIGSADNVLLGGALISNILKSKGYKIGNTFIEDIPSGIIKKIEKSKKVILPIDVITGKKDDPQSAKIIELGKKKVICAPDEGILDIGPKSVFEFSKYIKKAKTIIWNGPLGYFENLSFAYGTLSLGRLISSRGKKNAYVVTGGGETVCALQKIGLSHFVDWVSTGGGAMLAYLGGERMPGFKKIIK